MLPRSPPLAGFSHQAESLCVPIWMVPRPNTPKISACLRHCSRFLENRAGDLVRLHCVTGMLREILSILAIVLSVRISLPPPMKLKSKEDFWLLGSDPWPALTPGMAIFAEPKRDIISASRAKREQLPNRGPARKEARQARTPVHPLDEAIAMIKKWNAII